MAAGCINRKTGKVTISIEDTEKTKELVKKLLSAARVVEGGKKSV